MIDRTLPRETIVSSSDPEIGITIKPSVMFRSGWKALIWTRGVNNKLVLTDIVESRNLPEFMVALSKRIMPK